MEFPNCMKCGDGRLVPLSDYGTEGASVTYKAWVCVNPTAASSCASTKAKSPTAKLEPVPS